MIKVRRFCVGKRGVSSVELALIFPVLIIVLGGGYELTMYALVQSKIQRIGASVADLIARQPTTQENAEAILRTIITTAKPLDFAQNGSAIVSHVSNKNQTSDPTKMTINWQLKLGQAISNVGSMGDVPQMPGGLTALKDEEYIICEMFYTYRPIIPAPFLASHYTAYKIIVHSVRGDSMVTFLPT